MISLTLHRQFTVPLECENVLPDVTAGLSHAELAALPVFMGKRQYRLDEFFTVEGERSDQLEIAGDCAKVKWLGRGMSRGRLTVRGNAGMHLGSQMSGGTIEVTGNASDWVGAEMRGGTITVGGNAGGQIGAAYRGGTTGMRGGTIIIGGAAGLEVGMRMKRGTIIIRGPVRDFAGLQMRGGTQVGPFVESRQFAQRVFQFPGEPAGLGIARGPGPAQRQQVQHLARQAVANPRDRPDRAAPQEPVADLRVDPHHQQHI
jgi:formylmethanofuran dehydrogenase subunit C